MDILTAKREIKLSFSTTKIKQLEQAFKNSFILLVE